MPDAAWLELTEITGCEPKDAAAELAVFAVLDARLELLIFELLVACALLVDCELLDLTLDTATDAATLVEVKLDDVAIVELLDLLLELDGAELALVLELIDAIELLDFEVELNALELDTLTLVKLELTDVELTEVELADFELELIPTEPGELLDVFPTIDVVAELVTPLELLPELLELVLEFAAALLELPAKLLELFADEGISLPAADWLVCDAVLFALLLTMVTVEEAAVDVGVGELPLPFPPPPPPQAESVKLVISAPE